MTDTKTVLKLRTTVPNFYQKPSEAIGVLARTFISSNETSAYLDDAISELTMVKYLYYKTEVE